MALYRQGVSVSTAASLSVGPQVPHALRIALRSVDLDTLRQAVGTVRGAIEGA